MLLWGHRLGGNRLPRYHCEAWMRQRLGSPYLERGPITVRCLISFAHFFVFNLAASGLLLWHTGLSVFTMSWDLVSDQGRNPGPELGARSLNRWTTGRSQPVLLLLHHDSDCQITIVSPLQVLGDLSRAGNGSCLRDFPCPAQQIGVRYSGNMISLSFPPP